MRQIKEDCVARNDKHNAIQQWKNDSEGGFEVHQQKKMMTMKIVSLKWWAHKRETPKKEQQQLELIQRLIEWTFV